MAFYSYFIGSNEQQQDQVDPPAYSNEAEDGKCGTKPKPCEKPPKPCEKPPKPCCEPQPQPPKPCCTPCPPRPPKPCPAPCPKPPPCRKPCNPCDKPRKPCDDQIVWDHESRSSDSEGCHSTDTDCQKPCSSEQLCIYNACNLALWVSINLLIIAGSFVAAVTADTVNVLLVIFLALNLAINFLGLAGLYNNCPDYIQLAAWWQWIAVPVSLFMAYQASLGGSASLIAFLSAFPGPIATALVAFLNTLPPALLNLLFAALLVAYAAALIFFAFEWAQAACARCVVVDCDNECGWFKAMIEVIIGMLPASVGSIITMVLNTLAHLCPTEMMVGVKSVVPAVYGSPVAAHEKAGQAV